MGEVQVMKEKSAPIGNEAKGRRWIYPRLIKGKLYKYRNITSWLLLALLFAGPFIRINGEQLILLNVLERRFAFFGVVFSPQDFYLFVLAMLIFVVFIVLFTVVFGRVWCGWACPQTIFMEMVFRKIERWIEGDALAQRKLDQSPLTPVKFFKKGAKHAIFILISFLISNIFLAYIIGTPNLLAIIREPISDHLTGFIAIWVFTGLFYGVFAYMREIVCTVVCPYGRLQGVLLDNQSMIVAYDYERGEPRGKRKREPVNPISTTGDCVDCGLCVQVCPTGIDIRNGTQLECINCTLCIDACDMVMEKINRPTRLIGFKSEEQIATRAPFTLGKRMYGYAAVLLVLMTVLGVLVWRRTDINTTILRAGGTIYQLRGDTAVSNLYNAELINNTNQSLNFEIRPAHEGTSIQYIRSQDTLGKGEKTKLTFFVVREKASIEQYKSDIELDIWADGKLIDKVTTTFIAPNN